ncbi:tetratricopeptide repeat protein [Nocardia huaxiensis]|uniref:Tetratricopeptide repeat protein n=1 Tax=Nocardia huaxiensis TaxID=2755382 RepID=A0A7D6ZHL9_9NOCA|nr:XRE family transcriptional regulator [Nocardia huaxiensis]QLY28183.1 tetratricopeptide repeat protein [Nocardia huaxiensis]
MSREDMHGLASPDPRRISTRREFGRELTLARRRSGQTVRQVANRVKLPTSTLGGYFAGTHLPALQPANQLVNLLAALGIDRAEDVRRWGEAYWRVREGSMAGTALDDPANPARLLVSTRAPVDRLAVEPRLRGREELVRQLDDRVSGAEGAAQLPAVHVLQGLSGCGKSMVAITVAHHAASAGIPTYWIPGENQATFAAGMHALTVQLGASGYLTEGGSPPDTIWRCLDDLSHRWLLVLDNVDDPQQVLALPGTRIGDGTGWLRPIDGGRGTVLVTTRDGDQAVWGSPPPPWMTIHRLGGLSAADGAEVLAELSAAGGPEDAAELSDRLGGLPLALMLAGRYLAESHAIPEGLGANALPRTYREYRDALRESGYRDLMPAHGRGDERLMIGRSWRLSLDLLSRRGVPRASALLGTLACFGTEPIPYSDLLVAESLAGTPLFEGITARGVWQALRALEDLGLITINASGDCDEHASDSLALHPLVRDMARQDAVSGRPAVAYLETSTTLLRSALRNAHPKSPAAWHKWRSLLSHCTAPLDLLAVLPTATSPVRAALELGGDAAQFLRARGLREQSEATFAVVLRLCAERLTDTDPLRLDIEHNFARLRYDQSRYAEAEQLYRAVLARRRARLGPRHADTLTTQHYLARTLRRLRRFDEARQLLNETYQARLTILGGLHPDTLTSRQGIADLLRAEGHGAQAESLYAEVLAARAEVLGPEHPATLSTRQYHAELLHAHGEIAEAEAELRRLWSANQRVRGVDHPRTIAVGSALVDVLRDTGRPGDAVEVAVIVAVAARRLFGAMHPTTQAVRQSLALIESEIADMAGESDDSPAPPPIHRSEAT